MERVSTKGSPVIDKDANSIPTGNEAEIVQRMAVHVAALMGELNLDLSDPNFVETPERVAKMYMEMFHGLREGSEPQVTTLSCENCGSGLAEKARFCPECGAAVARPAVNPSATKTQNLLLVVIVILLLIFLFQEFRLGGLS